MTTITGHTTRANGTILTAAIYNFDHVNHVTNAQNLNATKMEGATPPVVDGQVVVWNGTGGALLRTSGYYAVNQTVQIIAGTGLSGGGDLSVSRTLAVDFATQAEAEAATSIVDVMSPLRVDQRIQILKATQAEAEAATNNTKWVTPLRVDQRIAFLTATLAEAQAGTDVDSIMTPLRVAQAIAALAPIPITIGSTITVTSGGVDTGIASSGAAAFIYNGPSAIQLSMDGGSSYQSMSAGGSGIVFAKNGVAVYLTISAAGAPSISRLTWTPSGNMFLKVTGGSGTAVRMM